MDTKIIHWNINLVPCSIATLKSYRFRVPSYQRGYRWERLQVRQLLSDLSEANPDVPNYLQSIVVAPVSEDSVHYYDLIDGQQRLTTIYLILKALSKQWIMKEKQGHEWIIESASRAIQGNLQSNVRAIAISYRYNCLTLKCYLDSLPSEQDKEMLSDIAGEIISDFPPDKLPRTTEICKFSNVLISELDKLDSFIYIRANEL